MPEVIADVEHSVAIKMRPKLDVLFVLFVSFQSVTCKCLLEDLSVDCTTFDDVRLYGNQNWQELIINNTMNEPLQTLKADSFKTTPYLVQLSIEGFVNKLEPGAFNGVENILQIEFRKNELKELSGEAFANVSVAILAFIETNLRSFKPGCFSEVRNLQYIAVIKNYLPVIKVGVFNKLKIKKLNLAENSVGVIEDGAFADMNMLEELLLNNNNLSNFESERLLTRSLRLRVLKLSGNLLTKVTKKMFQSLSILREIYLEKNLVETIEDGTFEDLPNLTTLQLNYNRLKYIHSTLFPADARLISLSVNNNMLTYFSVDILNRLPELSELCIGGNPWSCQCLNQLFKWRLLYSMKCKFDDVFYFTGTRPTCFVPSPGMAECTNTTSNNNTQNLMEHYLKELSQYPDIPSMNFFY